MGNWRRSSGVSGDWSVAVSCNRLVDGVGRLVDGISWIYLVGHLGNRLADAREGCLYVFGDMRHGTIKAASDAVARCAHCWCMYFYGRGAMIFYRRSLRGMQSVRHVRLGRCKHAGTAGGGKH